jgi:hypothetical protein
MTENMPPTLEQTRQLHRSLTQKVLDRAASDPQWKQQLIDDPEAAIRGAGFPETQQLAQQQAQGGEVLGQHHKSSGGTRWHEYGGGGGGSFCPYQCSGLTTYWYQSWT